MTICILHKYPCKITETHSITMVIFILYICMYYDLSKSGVGWYRYLRIPSRQIGNNLNSFESVLISLKIQSQKLN